MPDDQENIPETNAVEELVSPAQPAVPVEAQADAEDAPGEGEPWSLRQDEAVCDLGLTLAHMAE